jgi:sensor histidine kinase YesM
MNKSRTYWLCQICGWLGMVGIETINYTFFITGKFNQDIFFFFLFCAALGMLLTNILRKILSKLQFFQNTSWFIWIWAFLFTFFISLLITISNNLIYLYQGSKFSELLSLISFLGNIMNWMRYVGVWVIIYFLYKLMAINNSLQQDKLRVEALAKSAELELLRSQLNPHFLFNALNSIKALISIDQEKSRTAIVLLSELLRFTLNYGQDKEIAIKTELQEVQKYLELEHIRFGSKMQVDWQIDEQVHNQTIPPGTMLTLVENAIKHGKTDDEGILRIGISLELLDEQIHIRVANSGEWKPQKNQDGMGIRLIQRRLESLYGGKAVFEQRCKPNWVIIDLVLPKQLP